MTSPLTDDVRAHPSLCGDWTVHDIAAHLINNAKTTRLGIVRNMVRARFDFDRQNAQGVERQRGATPRETLARLQQVATRPSTPPAPLDSRLVEEVVHGEDIRRPPGIKRTYPSEAVVRSLQYQARTPVSLGGAKQLVACRSSCRPPTQTCRSVTPGSLRPSAVTAHGHIGEQGGAG